MKYFLINYDYSVINETGQDSQILGYYQNYDSNSIKHAAKNGLLRDTKFPEGLILKSTAKFTDIIYSTYIDQKWLIFSERFNQLIEQFHIPDAAKGSVVMKRRNSRKPYFFFQPTSPAYECLNYQLSDLQAHYVKKGEAVDLFSIDSAESFKRMNEVPGKWLSTKCKKPIFDFSTVDHDLILLPVPYGLTAYAVSEKLKNAIENASLIGFDFELLPTSIELAGKIL